MLNNFENSFDNNHVIPMTWLHWAWQTWFDENFLEVELEIGKIFQTLQEFDYRFTPFRFPVFQADDIGKIKAFLVSSRYCEVNGNEFFPADMDSYKIVVGEIVEISTFENINPYPPKTWVTEKWLHYTPTTPAYKILVHNIISLETHLRKVVIQDLDILDNNLPMIETDFYFHQLRHEQVIRKYNQQPYQIQANMLAYDLIHIFLRISEYSTADYLITKETMPDKEIFYIRYFEQYFVDDDFYLLANHQLSQYEIELLMLDDDICKKFFGN